MRRWGRRLVTVPAVVVSSLAVLACSPVLLVAAALADLVGDWRRHRWVRVHHGPGVFDIPEEPAARVDWPYDEWDRVDRWIADRRRP